MTLKLRSKQTFQNLRFLVSREELEAQDYQRVQSQGHHAIDLLEERPGRGKGQRPTLQFERTTPGLKEGHFDTYARGSTFGGVYVPCIYSHAT